MLTVETSSGRMFLYAYDVLAISEQGNGNATVHTSLWPDGIDLKQPFEATRAQLEEGLIVEAMWRREHVEESDG